MSGGLQTWTGADLGPLELRVPPAILAELEAERMRQLVGEGWSLAHDDDHREGELLKAACAYLTDAMGVAVYDAGAFAPRGWPWSLGWWKPKSPRRGLVRAGALALAEAERIERAGVERPPLITLFLNIVGDCIVAVDLRQGTPA